MFTKAIKKKEYLNYMVIDISEIWTFPYFKRERILSTLPWRLFKDVYF